MTTFRAESIYTVPMAQVGPPVAGTWLKGTTIVDANGQHWNCVTSGTPGTWVGGDTATSPQQMVYVAKNGRLAADGGTGAFENPFLTIQGAIDSITDAATGKRYVVKVAPGDYAENVTIGATKAYIHLEGFSGTTGTSGISRITKSDGVNPLLLLDSCGTGTIITNISIYNSGGRAVQVKTTSATCAPNFNNCGFFATTEAVLFEQSGAFTLLGVFKNGCHVQSGTVKATKTGGGGSASLWMIDSQFSTIDIDPRYYVYTDGKWVGTITQKPGAAVYTLHMVAGGAGSFVVGDLVTCTSGCTGRVKVWDVANLDLVIVPTNATAPVAANHVIVGAVDWVIDAGGVSALSGGLTPRNNALSVQTSSPQLVKVGPNEKFTTIQSAIDSITDAATGKRYVVKVAPGDYAENVVMKNCVYLEGTGVHSTSIFKGTSITITDAVNPAVLISGAGSLFTSISDINISNAGAGGGIKVDSTLSTVLSLNMFRASTSDISINEVGRININILDYSVISGTLLWTKAGTGLYSSLSLRNSWTFATITLPFDVAFDSSGSASTEATLNIGNAPVQILSMASDPSAYTVGELVGDASAPTRYGRVKARRTGATHELLVVPIQANLLVAGAILGVTSGTNIVCSAASALCGGLMAYTSAAGIQTSSPQLVKVGPNEKFVRIQDAIDSITDGAWNKKYTIEVSPSGRRYEEQVTLKTGVCLRAAAGSINGVYIYSATGNVLTVPVSAICSLEGFYVYGNTVVEGYLQASRTVFESGAGVAVSVGVTGIVYAEGDTQFRAGAGGKTGVSVANGGTAILWDVTFITSDGGVSINAALGSAVNLYKVAGNLSGSTFAGTVTNLSVTDLPAFAFGSLPTGVPNGYECICTDRIAGIGVRGTLNCALLAAGNFDTILETYLDNNDPIDFQLTGDNGLGIGVTVDPVVGGHVHVHYESTVSTVALVEAAILALGASIQTRTAGTGATVLTNATDNIASTPLVGGDSRLGLMVRYDATYNVWRDALGSTVGLTHGAVFPPCTLATRPLLGTGINETWFVSDALVNGALLTWTGTAWVDQAGNIVP